MDITVVKRNSTSNHIITATARCSHLPERHAEADTVSFNPVSSKISRLMHMTTLYIKVRTQKIKDRKPGQHKLRN